MTTTSAQKWLDEMIIELRLRNIRGTAIGDAAAAVETHCQESGETPGEAFGDPREYARSLIFPEQEVVRTTPIEWTRVLGPVAAGVIAVVLVGPVTSALYERTSMTITWGQVAALAVVGLFTLLVMRMLGAVLHSSLNTALMFGGACAVTAALMAFWTTPALHLPAWLGVLVVLALLVVSVVGQRRTLDTSSDPLVDPRDGSTSNAPAKGAAWVFPLVAAFMALITLIPRWFA